MKIFCVRHWEEQSSNGGPGTTVPPLATAMHRIQVFFNQSIKYLDQVVNLMLSNNCNILGSVLSFFHYILKDSKCDRLYAVI